MSTETEWRDKQLNDHFTKEDMYEEVSNCCGEPIDMDGSCMNCREHCEVISLGEWMYEQEVNARCDEAESKKELERENG